MASRQPFTPRTRTRPEATTIAFRNRARRTHVWLLIDCPLMSTTVTWPYLAEFVRRLLSGRQRPLQRLSVISRVGCPKTALETGLLDDIAAIGVSRTSEPESRCTNSLAEIGPFGGLLEDGGR